MSEEKIFANGFSFKRHEKAPDFVVGNMSIKVDDAIAFLKEQKNEKGWVNLSVKTVSVYRARLLEKMNLRNNAELTHYGLKHGLAE